ncbi:MAG: hypothetical protein LBV55_04065 [Acholeplasmatales bacterium]|jgi:hypothetical protein|nr:hypothetical protein [Acholeplasmatales bacterium]
MKKCKLCSLTLQDQDETLINYTPNLELAYCKNCFSLINYNKELIHYLPSQYEVEFSEDLCLIVISILDLPFFISERASYQNIKNKILVITKLDLLTPYFDFKEINQQLSNNFIAMKYIDVYFVRNDVDKRYLALYFNAYEKIHLYGYPLAGKTTLFKYYSNESTQDLKPCAFKTKDSLSSLVNHYEIVDHVSLNNNYLYQEFNYQEYGPLIFSNKITRNYFNLLADQSLMIERLFIIDLLSKDANLTCFFYDNVKIKKYQTIKKDNYFHQDIFGLKSKNTYSTVKLSLRAHEQLYLSSLGFLTFNKQVEINLTIAQNYRYFISDLL